MNVLNLLRGTAALSCLLALGACGTPESRVMAPTAQTVKFQQIRNATIKVDYAGTTFLIDPMLANAIIVTHTHLDHWDGAAKQSLPRNLPLFAQNEPTRRAFARMASRTCVCWARTPCSTARA